MKRQKNTRNTKVEIPKDNPKKEVWNQSNGYLSFKLTDSQLDLADKIEANTLTFVEGSAGTGKSLTVLHTFVKEYLKDKTKQIIVVRTPVEAGMDKIGALPNDYFAKIEPHFDSTKRLLEQLLSKGKVEADMNHRLHFKIPNYAIGSTFDNALVMVDECFTDEHEFLTLEGWKNVSAVSMQDKVMQYDTDGSMKFVSPSRVITKEYEGKIITYDKSQVSMQVTENHNLAFSNVHGDVSLHPANSHITQPKTFINAGYINNSEYDVSDAEIKMAVALQADGSLDTRNMRAWQIQISKERKVERFNAINSSLGNPFHEVKSATTKNSSTAVKKRFYSSDYKNKLLIKDNLKVFNLDILLKFSKRQLVLFIEELAFWDGSFYNLRSNNPKTNKNFLYSSTNKENIDIVQALACISGFKTSVGKSVDNRKESYKDSYKLNIMYQTTTPATFYTKERVFSDFKGTVYCVTVPSGMLVTRCNHKVHISGNCQQLSPMILKLILERTGQNSKVVVIGDNTQLYADNRNLRNALKDALPRFFKGYPENPKPKFDDIAYHRFTVEDVMRSDIVKSVITAYS